MKKLLLVFVFILSGCVANLANMSQKTQKVNIGMTEQDVVTLLGRPTTVSAREDVKIYNYSLYTTVSSAFADEGASSFYIGFKNGVVVLYGGADVIKEMVK